MFTPQILYPNYQKVTYNSSGWALEPKTPTIHTKMTFLIDQNVLSYGESIVGLIKHYKMGKLIGEPTGGANGNINKIHFKNGYTFIFTGMFVIEPRGKDYHKKGIQPDILIRPTINATCTKKDEALGKAIEEMKNASF